MRIVMVLLLSFLIGINILSAYICAVQDRPWLMIFSVILAAINFNNLLNNIVK